MSVYISQAAAYQLEEARKQRELKEKRSGEREVGGKTRR